MGIRPRFRGKGDIAAFVVLCVLVCGAAAGASWFWTVRTTTMTVVNNTKNEVVLTSPGAAECRTDPQVVMPGASVSVDLGTRRSPCGLSWTGTAGCYSLEPGAVPRADTTTISGLDDELPSGNRGHCGEI